MAQEWGRPNVIERTGRVEGWGFMVPDHLRNLYDDVALLTERYKKGPSGMDQPALRSRIFNETQLRMSKGNFDIAAGKLVMSLIQSHHDHHPTTNPAEPLI